MFSIYYKEYIPTESGSYHIRWIPFMRKIYFSFVVSCASVLLFCCILSCGKKAGSKEKLPEVTENWVELEGKYGRMPMSIRLNQGLESVAGHKDLHHQAGITVAILNPMKNGFPDSEEETQLKKIENSITAELKGKGIAVFAAAVTTGGSREFIFYTGNPEAVETSFKILTGKIYTHTLQLNIQKDKNWAVYKQFASAKN